MTFETHYPQLNFLLSQHSAKPVPSKELTFDLAGCELVYLYKLGKCVFQFLEWLEDKKHTLVIIEDDYGVLKGFLEEEPNILMHPQIELMMPFDTIDRSFCMECARRFPSEQIQVLSTEKCPFELDLKRASTLTHGRFCEDFYRDRLFANLLHNFIRLGDSFNAGDLKGACEGMPAIVCGAGPSLADHIETLKNVNGKALILAGGSTIAALSNQGVIPDLGFAIDPNPCEYPRLKASTAFTTPLIYGSRLYPDVFNTTVGALGYLQTMSSDPIECYLAEQLGVPFEPLGAGFGNEAMSVTTTAIAFAHHMGCSPIILAGIDMAYTDMQFYAPGVFTETNVDMTKRKKDTRVGEELIEKTNAKGDIIYTSVKWLMESAAISKFAKSIDTPLYKASEKGLGFDGIEMQSIENVLSKGNVKPLYIDKLKRFDKDEVKNVLGTIFESLQRCAKQLEEFFVALDLKKDEYCTDHALITLHKHDLEGEIAYTLLLQPSLSAIRIAVEREVRGFEKHHLWQKERAIYKQLERMCTAHLETFALNGYSADYGKKLVLQNGG